MKKAIISMLVLCLSGFMVVSCETMKSEEMLATTGEVCFDVQPAAADVYIDGAYAGQAKGCYTVNRGYHTITIEKKNFETYRRTVYVRGAERIVSVKLAPQHGKSKIPPGQQKVKTIPPGQQKVKTIPPVQQKVKKTPPVQQKVKKTPPVQQKVKKTPPVQQKVKKTPSGRDKVKSPPEKDKNKKDKDKKKEDKKKKSGKGSL